MAFSVQNNPVTLDDQQKINRFAGISAQLMELKEELTAKQAELESLVCAEDETTMCNDDTSTIPYLIGDALVDMDSQEVKAELERTKTICHAEIADLMHKLGDCKQTFMELRAVLYARFGSTVNLDIDNGI